MDPAYTHSFLFPLLAKTQVCQFDRTEQNRTLSALNQTRGASAQRSVLKASTCGVSGFCLSRFSRNVIIEKVW